MKFDFTEGEWYYQSDADDYTHIVRVRNKKNEAYFLCQLSQNSSGESRANARLISCAPEMLMALIERCQFACNNCFGSSHEHYDKCQECIIKNHIKIIEKATGKKLEDIINE